MKPDPSWTAVFMTLFLLLPAVASSSVVHKVDMHGDRANVTSLMTLTSDEEVNLWDITVELPEDSHILSLKDSRGEVEYNFRGGDLTFETNSGPPRTEERVRLNYTLENVVSKKFEPLETAEASLFGFEDERTEVLVSSRDIVSYYTPFGFRSEGSDSNIKFQGEGSMFLKFYRSESGNETEHYHYFSNGGEVKNAEKFFPILPYITGIQSPHERFPVVFLNDSAYDSAVNEWSSGRYKTGGLILMRGNLSGGKTVSTLIHETMHGFDEKLLKWDGTDSAYFDEGMAKFSGFLVNQKMDVLQPEIFGGRVHFTEGDKGYYYESRSSPDVLWNYYKNKGERMKSWTPWRDVDPDVREFGYAYSELLVRDYVGRNGLLSLRNLSEKLLNMDKKIKSTDEKAKIFSRLLGTFRPCFREDRQAFEECLDQINEEDFELKNLEINITGEKEHINISSDFHLPKRKTGGLSTMINGWIESLLKFVESALEVIPWT